MKTRIKILMRILLLALFCLSFSRCSTEPVNLEGNLQDNALKAKTSSKKSSDSQLKFTAHLNGINEVPSNDSKATGEMIVTISEDETMVHYKLIVANIGNITASHFHVAPIGVSGPPRVWIFNSNGTPTGRVNGIFKEGYIMPDDFFKNGEGVPFLTMSDFISLLRNGEIYVNVHTTDMPSGEIRGNF